MTRIEYAAGQPPSFLARWTSRLAMFCVLLLVSALFLHRVFALSTPVAMNITAAAFGGAMLTLLMAAISGLDIWMTGRQGTARVVTGIALALALLTVPAAVWVLSRDWPAVTDITTDTERPPPFAETLKQRPEGSNPAEYRREAFETLQKAAYPDIKPLTVPRSEEETFELVLQALHKMKLVPVSEIAPADSIDGFGTIELTDRTLILGFKDDVAIRIAGDENQARVDVRSASRYGQNDFGRNAERIRTIFREIVGRLEASVPAAGTRTIAASRNKAAKIKKQLMVKQPAGARRQTGGPRPKPDPSRSNARRAREPLE